MTFSAEQIVAVFGIAKAMAGADGKMTNDEKDVITVELLKHGIVKDTPESCAVELAAAVMPGDEVIRILSNLSIEQKKYVCGYLCTIMFADGVVDEKEKNLISLVSSLAKFPNMTYVEAVDYWGKHGWF